MPSIKIESNYGPTDESGPDCNALVRMHETLACEHELEAGMKRRCIYLG
jgi:hypothetical protein